MASSEKKRQKKLEKKKAKRKAKKHELVQEKSLGLAKQLERVANAPIYRCWRAETLFNSGIGQVLLAREMPDGFLAVASFLVDVYCLGVKDAFAMMMSKFEFREKFAENKLPHPIIEIEPAEARKLVEDAVEYARKIGFSPHPDYHKAKMLFGDIDPAECHEEFEFGQNGKPYFVAGPYDNQARCQRILATLHRTCGSGNYHFLMPVSGSTPIDEIEDIELEEDMDEGWGDLKRLR